MTAVYVWTIWAGEGSEPHRTLFTDEIIAEYYDRSNQYFEKFPYWFADADGNPTDPSPLESLEDWDDY
jgi:hypothetical protein